MITKHENWINAKIKWGAVQVIRDDTSLIFLPFTYFEHTGRLEVNQDGTSIYNWDNMSSTGKAMFDIQRTKEELLSIRSSDQPTTCYQILVTKSNSGIADDLSWLLGAIREKRRASKFELDCWVKNSFPDTEIRKYSFECSTTFSIMFGNGFEKIKHFIPQIQDIFKANGLNLQVRTPPEIKEKLHYLRW